MTRQTRIHTRYSTKQKDFFGFPAIVLTWQNCARRQSLEKYGGETVEHSPLPVSYPVQGSAEGRWESSCPCPPDQRTSTDLGSSSSCIKGREPKALLGFYVCLWQLRLAASSSVCNGSLMLGLICTGHVEGRGMGCRMDGKWEELPELKSNAALPAGAVVTAAATNTWVSCPTPPAQEQHKCLGLWASGLSFAWGDGLGKNQVPLDAPHVLQNPL